MREYTQRPIGDRCQHKKKYGCSLDVEDLGTFNIRKVGLEFRVKEFVPANACRYTSFGSQTEM